MDKQTLKRLLIRLSQHALKHYDSSIAHSDYPFKVVWGEPEHFSSHKLHPDTAAYVIYDDQTDLYVIVCNHRVIKNLSKDMLYQIMSHEIAHIIEFVQYGYSGGHGLLWESIHKAMGGNGTQYIDCA